MLNYEINLLYVCRLTHIKNREKVRSCQYKTKLTSREDKQDKMSYQKESQPSVIKWTNIYSFNETDIYLTKTNFDTGGLLKIDFQQPHQSEFRILVTVNLLGNIKKQKTWSLVKFWVSFVQATIVLAANSWQKEIISSHY